MRKYDSEILIDTLIEDIINCIETVKTEFVDLPDEALKTKPGIDAWSVLECLQHLIIANKHYNIEIDKKLKATNSISKEQFKSGTLGNYFANSMKPKSNGDISSKMKTMKKFRPTDALSRSTIDEFIEEQQKLIALLESSKKVNLEKVKIKSAIGGWLMFKLGDAFRFVVAHTQRHVLQAQNTLVVLHETA